MELVSTPGIPSSSHAFDNNPRPSLKQRKMKKQFSLFHELMLRLVLFWFTVSPLVVIWDASFILMRPRSLPGGDLHFIWIPCKLASYSTAL